MKTSIPVDFAPLIGRPCLFRRLLAICLFCLLAARAAAAIWVPAHDETYTGTGWIPVWVGGYWDSTWVDGYYEESWVDGYYEDVWVDGHTENTWVDGYWDTSWTDGYYEESWNDGYYESVWNDGYYQDVWNDGYYDGDGNWNDGYWSSEWVDGSWSTNWVDGYWSSNWVDGYWNSNWVDGYWDTSWVDGYSTQVWVEGYTTPVWVEGYWVSTWVEGYWTLSWEQWTVTVHVDGHWEGEWTWTPTDIYGDWYWGEWSPDPGTVACGQAFTQSRSGVRSHVHYETNEAGDIQNFTSGPDYTAESRAATGTYGCTTAGTNTGGGSGTSGGGSGTKPAPSLVFSDRTFLNQTIVTITADMLNATVTGVASLPAPTGAISYTITQGVVSAPTGANPLGKYLTPAYSPITITATYPGDANYASTSVSAVFQDKVVYTPSAPSGLRTVLLGDNTFSFAWNPSSGQPDTGVGPDVYEISFDGGASVYATVSTGWNSAYFNTLIPATGYSVVVRGRDAYGNVSAWSAPLGVTTLAAGSSPVVASRWLDVNGDGLLDEVIDAGTPAFDHFVGEESSVEITYQEWVTDYIYIPGYSYVSGEYVTGEGNVMYYVPSQYIPVWDSVETTETVPVVTPVFRFVAEGGYDYHVGRLATRSDGTRVFRGVYTLPGADRGTHEWLPPGAWGLAAYHTFPFVMVRQAQPISKTSISVAGVPINIGMAGGATGPITFPLPAGGSATVNVGSGTGSVTIGGTTVSVGAGGTVTVNGSPVSLGTIDLGGGNSVKIDTTGITISISGGTTVRVNPDGSGSIDLPGGAGISVGVDGRLSVKLPPGTPPSVVKVVDILGKVLQGGAAVISVRDILGNVIPLPASGSLGDIDVGVTSKGRFAVGVKLGNDSVYWFEVIVAPLEIAVDANRDGVIAFNASDATSSTTPFRFWINDDDDSTIVGGVIKDTVPAPRPDWQDKLPASARDMEDFARLWINTSGITASLKPKSDGSADLYLGLKWTDTGGTNPGIRVFEHRETDGGTRYLTDQNIAYDQSLGRCILDASGPSSPLDQEGVVTGTQVYVLEPWIFNALSESQPVSHLLFEGCKVGKGQLKVVILKKQAGSFMTIGEGNGVWLDVMNIKSMYERAVATTGGPRSENGIDYTIPVPSDLTGPDDNNIPHPTMGWAVNDLGYPYRPDPAETQTYIVYVHGWRWSPEKANNRTETVFKRLWHLGYKGRLAALRWPTFYGGPDDDDSEPAGIFTYNNSEYRAWKSGESLKLYVNQLPSGYTRHVVAHSMGNIVAGSALKNGMSVANYIMLNAAVPAMCYDESTNLRQSNWNYTTPNTDPDAGTRLLAYIGKFGTLNTNVVNFFLTNDTATRTLWEINNSTWRPHRYNLGTTGYGYDPSAIVGRRLYITFFTGFGRYLIDPHEVMPYACQSLTRTVGADGRTRGSIGSVVDLDASFGFGDEHGAEWDRTYYATRAFYIELMRTLQIPVQP